MLMMARCFRDQRRSAANNCDNLFMVAVDGAARDGSCGSYLLTCLKNLYICTKGEVDIRRAHGIIV